MYPYRIITLPDGSGIYLYEIFILIGVLSAIIMCRVLADRRRMPAKLQNLILIGAVVAVVIGYLSAVLWQAVYNAIETGKFELNSGTGATFYGGLIGGAVCMLLIYFIGGKLLFKNTNEHLQWFSTFANIAGICIPLAHGFGRIGCALVGCCYGIPYDGPGAVVYTDSPAAPLNTPLFPVQAVEAAGEFVIAAVLTVYIVRCRKQGKTPRSLGLYLGLYAVLRFFLEFVRYDDRERGIFLGISTSQWISVAVLAAVALHFKRYKKTDCPL